MLPNTEKSYKCLNKNESPRSKSSKIRKTLLYHESLIENIKRKRKTTNSKGNIGEDCEVQATSIC